MLTRVYDVDEKCAPYVCTHLQDEKIRALAVLMVGKSERKYKFGHTSLLAIICPFVCLRC